MAAQEPEKAVVTSVTCSDSYSSSRSLISHHAGHKSCQQVAQQQSTALMAAFTKLIDASSPPSPPSLFSNPQPASTKSKLKTLHNDNLPSLLQIDRSSQDFYIEMLFLINRPFATLHSHPSVQGASSHIHVEVSHLLCDTSTVGRSSIHLSQGLGNFDRLTDGFNSHELSSQPFASFSTAHVKSKNTSTPGLSSFDRLTSGYNCHELSSQPHAIFKQLNSNLRRRESVQSSNKSIYSPSFAHLRREDLQHLSSLLSCSA
jgi:hypothetical protein